MVLKRNIIAGFFITMLSVLTLSACASDADKETGESNGRLYMGAETQSLEEQEESKEDPNQSSEPEQFMNGQSLTVNVDDQTWESAYLEVIYHLQDYLAPVYEPDGSNIRQYFDPSSFWVYLGLHDFDGDGALELIAGDTVTLAVFTYKDNEIIKIADLYIPDEVWCINGVYFKENSISVGCDGSGGTDWVNFGYVNGEYVLGIYRKRNLSVQGVTINGENGTLEEMNEIYMLDYDQREESEHRERIQLVNENGIWMLKYQSGEEAILDINFDFDTILW